MTEITGTVYGLVDPRDKQTRYIGQTVRPLPVRLSGHYGKSNKVPKVRAWVAELRAADLRPLIVPIREGVPKGDLLTAELEEITRIVAAGGALLNEQSTALGREILREREAADRAAAEMAGWRELADAAMTTLGGPVPPGEIPDTGVIAGEAWELWSQVRPDRQRTTR